MGRMSESRLTSLWVLGIAGPEALIFVLGLTVTRTSPPWNIRRHLY